MCPDGCCCSLCAADRLATDEYVEVQEAAHKKNFTRELEREVQHNATRVSQPLLTGADAGAADAQCTSLECCA